MRVVTQLSYLGVDLLRRLRRGFSGRFRPPRRGAVL